MNNYILEEKLTIKNLKELSTHIIQTEAKKNKIKVKIYPITIVEWYKTNQFKKEFKFQKWSQKFSALATPLDKLGLNYTTEKKIYLFIDNFKINKPLTPKHYLVDFIAVCFHELAHSYQTQHLNKYPPYEKYCLNFFDDFIQDNEPSHYEFYHDQYFKEIDADLYAVNKTNNFLKKYPNIYEKYKTYLLEQIKKAQYKYQNYDFIDFFEKFHTIFSKNPTIFFDEHFTINILYEYNSNQFKSIKNIINNDLFNKIPTKAFSLIITSPSFLEQLNITNLTTNEKQIFENALIYSINLETEKLKRNEEYQKEIKDIFDKITLLKESQKIHKRIAYLKCKHSSLTQEKTISKTK